MKKILLGLLSLVLVCTLVVGAWAEGLVVEEEPIIVPEEGEEVYEIESYILGGDDSQEDKGYSDFIIDDKPDINEEFSLVSNAAIDLFPGARHVSTISFEPDASGRIAFPRPYAQNVSVNNSGSTIRINFTIGAEFGTGPYKISYRICQDGVVISSKDDYDISGRTYAVDGYVSLDYFSPGVFALAVAVKDASGNFVCTDMSKQVIWNSDGTAQIIGDNSSAQLYPDFEVGGNMHLLKYLGKDTNVVIPTGLVSAIGTQAFNGCDNIVNLTIPNGVTGIYDYAFCGDPMFAMLDSLDNLENIYLPDSISYLATNAFTGIRKYMFSDLQPVYIHVNCNSFAHKELKNRGLPNGLRLQVEGHTIVTDPAIPATCTTDGKTEGSHCSVCGEVFTEQKTIPASGHTPVTDKGIEATYLKEGKTDGSHCSVCGAVLQEQKVVPKLVAKKVALNSKKATLTVGNTLQLKATLTPAHKTASRVKLTWTTSNDKVATVSVKGKVKAVGVGKATITVATPNGKKAICKITVKPKK